jgi:hypothetical protein
VSLAGAAWAGRLDWVEVVMTSSLTQPAGYAKCMHGASYTL